MSVIDSQFEYYKKISLHGNLEDRENAIKVMEETIGGMETLNGIRKVYAKRLAAD